MTGSRFVCDLLLALGVGGWLCWLLAQRRLLRASDAARAASFLLLSALAAAVLLWPERFAAPAGEVASFPAAAAALPLIGGLTAAGGFCLLCAGGPSALGSGAALGFLFGSAAYYAGLWRAAAGAWSVLGWFSGTFFGGTLPFLLAGVLFLLSFFVLDADARSLAAPLVGGLLLVWMVPPQLAVWRLRSAWALGPESLAQAVGVGPASGAERVAVAWLRPSSSTDTVKPVEEESLADSGIELSPESLAKLYRFVEAHHGQALFARQALSELRKGWLKRWDADRALQAAVLCYPGLAPPDYLTALGLIRAGPIVIERYAQLNALAERAKSSPAGFEDINQSQLIFEAFSAAYARFGDEDNARNWILRVDNLWPVYEKKVEVAPLEGFHDGEITGTVTEGGKPAITVDVGLFYVASDTATLDSGLLSQSSFPDTTGAFRFTNLGPGFYYLGVMGTQQDVREPIQGSPSLIEISPQAPKVRLEPIALP